MTELGKCMPHFVRCFKPNVAKKGGTYEPTTMLKQIRCLGVLDSINARKLAYPVRRKYADFYERFEDLNKAASKKKFKVHVEEGADFVAMSKKCVSESWPANREEVLLWGSTHVFLMLEGSKELEVIRK